MITPAPGPDSSLADDPREWLEADGLGGYASGTVSGIRTRRYHALLLSAVTPPTQRVVLVNGVEAWVSRGDRSQFLTRQRYAPDVTGPADAARIIAFVADPWPKWTYGLDDGTQIEHELFMPKGRPLVALRWRLLTKRPGLTLGLRPFLSGRDSHALHHENAGFRFEGEAKGPAIRWHPYESLPGIHALTNGRYQPAPSWYRKFQLDEERARGQDFVEDLAAPGLIEYDLSAGDAVLILGMTQADGPLHTSTDALAMYRRLRAGETRRRSAFPTRLHRAADAYVVQRGTGKTIVAGYPWFTDWGRDTFISIRGLCLATGRWDDARQILVQWAGAVSDGMLPNRFVDVGDAQEFNAVDASLWYIVAVSEYLAAQKRAGRRCNAADRRVLVEAVLAILTGYSKGTRYGIAQDVDGLLRCGVPGVQLTWMDAKVGDWVVTPRIGKPVEVEALWLNALRIGGEFAPSWNAIFERGLASFRERFWNPSRQALYDVIDVDHRPGVVDATVRPNQIFAVGGLPLTLLSQKQGRAVVATVEQSLLTPLGLRSLAPNEPGYCPRYEGGVWERDSAYHQGTVWPWLLGGFVEAWVRVRGDTIAVRAEARRRFLDPLLAQLDRAGVGHIAEIADAEAPYTPRGCPFQAWSVGEALRLDLDVLSRPPHDGDAP